MSPETLSSTTVLHRRLWRLAGLGLPPAPAGASVASKPWAGSSRIFRPWLSPGSVAEGATPTSAATLPDRS